MHNKVKISGIMRISHVALHFKDISKPFFFFTESLGLKPKFGFTFENQRIVILGAKGIDIELIESVDGKDHFDSMHIAFKVKDIEEAIKNAKNSGYRIDMDVYEPTKGIKEAIIEGPCGLYIQFVEEHLLTLIWQSLKGEIKDLKNFPEK